MKTYIIDALNVINISPTLKPILNSSKDNAVSAFCSELSIYLQKYPSYKFIVVVDGNLQPINKYNRNITLVESQNNTADNKIKEIFSNMPNKSNINIVSSDNEVYNYARMNAAGAITSIDFIQQISQKHSSKSPTTKSSSSKGKQDKPNSPSKKDVNFFKELFSNDDFHIDY